LRFSFFWLVVPRPSSPSASKFGSFRKPPPISV
jgi:hypothetical protein